MKITINLYYEDTVLIKRSNTIIFNDKARVRFKCGRNKNLNNIYIDEVAFSGYVVDSVLPSAVRSVILTSSPSFIPKISTSPSISVTPLSYPSELLNPSKTRILSNITYDEFETIEDSDDWTIYFIKKIIFIHSITTLSRKKSCCKVQN